MRRMWMVAGVLLVGLLLSAALVVGLSMAQGAEPLVPLGTAFTYQGRLKDNNSPVNDDCAFTFQLYDKAGSGSPPTGGTLLGTETVDGVQVRDGLFTVQLDFGAEAFAGKARWLQIELDCGRGAVTLNKRQQLTAVPYALYALGIPLAGTGSAATAARSDHTHTSYQEQVSGACAIGSTIRAVNADGTVLCQNDAPLNRRVPPTDIISTTVEHTGVWGWRGNPVTIGEDGLGLIAYPDSEGLKVAHCNDLACTETTSTILDSGNPSGSFLDLTIGPDGRGLISYINQGLRVAHCDDIACTGATITTLDPEGQGSDNYRATAVTIGSDGLGLIAYMANAGVLRVAHCEDVACTSAAITTIETGSGFVYEPSITIGSDGLALITYYSGGLGIVHCGNVACTYSSRTGVPGGGGKCASITIGVDGLGLISAYDDATDSLNVTHCEDVACTTASVSTLTDSAGVCSSLTIGPDGLGLISFKRPSSGDLIVAHCHDLACTGSTTTTVEDSGNVGGGISLTIGADGLPLISYDDQDSQSLKVVHCPNPLCIPYFRRR